MDKNSFMFSILNNPSLTPKDREKVISLITRDIEKDLMSQTRQIVREELKEKEATQQKGEQDDRSKKGIWIHDPRTVCSFLKKFSSDAILKFVFHSWDSGVFSGYDDFINKITTSLKKEDTFKDLYKYNIGLYYTLKNFILENGKTRDFSIPKEEDRIHIGLRYPEGVIREWMKNNPNLRLAEMPMTAFPPENRPAELCEIGNMEGLIEYFKHIIEFRDDDFTAMIHNTFRSADFSPSIDDNIQGISFYTYTSVVKDFLVVVLNNINGRILKGAPTTVKIFVDNVKDDSFELHILHEGSFADKDINDRKLRFSGNVASWCRWKGGSYDSLVSVCDYWVKSRFISDDEKHSKKSYRIDYLYPGVSDYCEDDFSESTATPLEQDAKGFEYVMRFYK